jgi:tetratricopeptide (TPR) repeat protein
MTRVSVGSEPPRLANQDDPAGRLLREAESAFRSQLSADLAWKRFQARRQGRALLRFAVLAAVAGLVVALIGHRLAVVRTPGEAPVLVAEQVASPQPGSPVPRPAASEERRLDPAASAAPGARPALPAAGPKAVGPTSVGPSAISSSRNAVAHSPVEPMTDAKCRAWASQAQPERAVDCYQTIGRESGIGAEVALYEAARLSAEALGDAPRALTLLELHGARFPNSVLRVEVEWLKIRSLERAGRLDEALAASETLLDSAVGRALAPKLHLLRGRIYSDARKQCALALPEYVALLGEPGPAGDEAEFKRAQCLEQLKRPDDARAAYQRYVARPDARSAAAARARLVAISNLAQSSEGQP